jgi:glycosyltransferase involved in cell wall biosynthesis
MKVAALMIVRDEADVLAVNLAHHRAVGIDEFWIVDNGSTDATPDILRAASVDAHVHVTRDDGPFAQSSMTTQLAREAHRAGADWVLPIDADEFWVTDGRSLHEILGATDARVGALTADVVNFVQGRWVTTTTGPGSLLTMTRRAPASVGTSHEAQWLVEHHHAGYVETTYPRKLVVRASPATTIRSGNHDVDGIEGSVEPTDGIVCLHAPLRARDRIAVKGLHAERMPAGEFRDGDGWQPRRWRELTAADVDAEWRANSYDDVDLDVFGYAHPLVVDTRLRDAVLPHVSLGARVRASVGFRRQERRRRRDLRCDTTTEQGGH